MGSPLMNRIVNAAIAASIMVVSGAATLSAADAQAARLTENAPAVMTAAIDLTTHTVVVTGAKPAKVAMTNAAEKANAAIRR